MRSVGDIKRVVGTAEKKPAKANSAKLSSRGSRPGIA